MKKIIYTFIFSLFSIVFFGQNFPGNSPELLLNKIVKPIKLAKDSQQNGYRNFYLKFNPKIKILTNVFKQFNNYNILSEKEFKVIQIFELSSFMDIKTYAIELENKEIGKLYYDYDPKYKGSYELEVIGGLTYPEDFCCNEIKIEIDKFDKSVRYDSPTESSISFTKSFYKGSPKVSMSIYKVTNSYKTGGNCLIFLFDDGTKLEFIRNEAQVKGDVAGSNFIYFANFELKDEEIKILSEKNITDLRVCFDNLAVEKFSALKIKAYLKCLIKINN